MKKSNKKIRTILGSLFGVSLVVAPIILSSCNNQENNKQNNKNYFKIFPTYASQADILLSLGINVDYYPHQAYRKNEYDYMNANSVNFDNYIIDKPEFKNKIKNKLAELLPSSVLRAKTWWGIKFDSISNDSTSEEYWTRKSGEILVYDRYLLDGSHEDTGGNRHIINQPKVNFVIEGDFKAARDIYTNFSIANAKNLINNQPETKLDQSLNNAIKTNENNYTYDEIYNYAYSFKKDNILLNKLKNKTSIEDWIINKDGLNKQPVFYASKDREKDQKIASLYEKFIISKKLKEKGFENLNYLNQSKKVLNSEFTSVLQHHPVYEQTSAISGSAMYTGAMRDAMLNWYKIASDLDDYAKTDEFKKVFANDKRKTNIENALSNMDLITRNLRQRLINIRNFLKLINVVDKNYNPDQNNFDNTNSKTVAIIMNAPAGEGVSTIQTQSKYGFMYFDLGLKAPFPKVDNFDEIKSIVNQETDQIDLSSNPVFNMDDNGWWWNLGENKFIGKNTDMFKDQFDTTFMLISGSDELSNDKETRIKTMNKNEGLNGVVKEDFNLWNDGIKSPIGYNMLLDRVILQLKTQFANNLTLEQKQAYDLALNWGEYWNNKF